MRNLNVLLIISSVVANAKSVGERESGFDRKRFDIGLETCMESFDVHVDKIIRTQDSRAMGAKYLNEAEVPGRDECMKLCCETPLCDVFVFEQKIPGSCYLFQCGSPEDFKCKFTQHRNYTSAVLSFNSRLVELENRMKLTKHEEELTMLRKLQEPGLDSTTSIPTALSTKVPTGFSPQTDKQNNTLRNRCSRYQFECRASGECIAIYNACDAIPQCSDGSDEAPELDCPTISGTSHPNTFHDQLKSLKTSNKNLSQVEKVSESLANVPEPAKPVKPTVTKVQATQTHRGASSSSSSSSGLGYVQQNEQTIESGRPKMPEQPQPGPANQPRYYGREGEIVQYPMNGAHWQGSYPNQHQDENNYIFSHRTNGVVPESGDSQFPVNYNNDANHGDYIKYTAGSVNNNNNNNGYYAGSGPVYYSGPNGWIQRMPQPQHAEDVPQRPMIPLYGSGMSGSVPSDYYYEDSQLRGRFPPVAQDPRWMYNSDMFRMNQKNIQTKETIKEPETGDQQERKSQENSKMTESKKKALENVPPIPTTVGAEKAEPAAAAAVTMTMTTTTTAKPTTLTSAKEETPKNHGPRVPEHLKMTQADAKDIDGINERPSGAILSLTLGMCITAIMITLVGCRLRVVRKRMRRNGKSPYAHDADFLVNGMYL